MLEAVWLALQLMGFLFLMLIVGLVVQLLRGNGDDRRVEDRDRNRRGWP
jgi:hypothetical protein